MMAGCHKSFSESDADRFNDVAPAGNGWVFRTVINGGIFGEHVSNKFRFISIEVKAIPSHQLVNL